MVKIYEAEKLYDHLTSVRFEVRGKIYEVDIGEELIIDSEDVHSQVERVPAVMGYFGTIVALLHKEYEDKMVLKKKIEAMIDRKARDAGIIGEVRVDKMIKRQSKWVEANMEVNKAKFNYEKAKNLYDSLREKSISLISRSNDIRMMPSDSIRGLKKKDIIRTKSGKNS